VYGDFIRAVLADDGHWLIHIWEKENNAKIKKLSNSLFVINCHTHLLIFFNEMRQTTIAKGSSREKVKKKLSSCIFTMLCHSPLTQLSHQSVRLGLEHKFQAGLGSEEEEEEEGEISKRIVYKCPCKVNKAS
jgi:hypothetical protein